MKLTFGFSAIALLIFSACTPSITDFNWLEGKWKRDFNETIQFEEWTFQQDTLRGEFYYIAFEDTTITEIKSIYNNEGTIVLEIANPENDIVQLLELENAAHQSLHFINPLPEQYPQKMNIERFDDSLLIHQSARINQFQKGVTYDYELVK